MKFEKWNDNWKFWIHKDSFALDWNPPKDIETVCLPHDAMREATHHKDSKNRGNTGYYDGGDYHYVKRLPVSKDEYGKKYILKFEGVYQNASVFVNHQLAGSHHYGYSEFYVCLNPYLRYGEENEIHVIVKNGMMPNSRWYSGSGIYRDVYLITSGFVRIRPGKVQIAAADVDSERASLSVRLDLVNEETGTRAGEAEILLTDRSGEAAASDRFPVVLRPGETVTYERRLFVENPDLWSDENPSLYHCEIKIRENGQILDECRERFGIRKLQLDPKRGLRVNGRTVKLRGACIHHDSGILGAATYEDAQYRQALLLKKAGFNAVRSSHQPMAPAMLRACDELGLYVMDEAFDMWTKSKSPYDYSLNFEEDWERDVAAMVEKDYNHPCVVMYSAGNEIPESGTEAGSLIGLKISSKIRSMDPGRYTVICMNGIFMAGDRIGEIAEEFLTDEEKRNGVKGNVNTFMTAMSSHIEKIVNHPIISERIDRASAGVDIAGYNYMAARYEPDGVRNPHRIIVGSESYPPEIAGLWKEVLRLPYLIGDFTWTGWDYIGEAGVGIPAYRWGEGGFGAAYPCTLAYSGDLDLTGFRRPVSYFREIVFGLRREPYIAVQNPEHYGENLIKTNWVLSDAHADWSWKGCEGRPVVVEVYGGGDEAELILNGKSLGRKPAGEKAGYRVLFETEYAPGILTAISYENGRVIGRTELVSAGEPKLIELKAEMYKNRELLFVDICIKDENGGTVRAAGCKLEAQISGGRLLGFGNGNPKSEVSYTGNCAEIFEGRAFLVVKREGENQLVSVKTDDGLNAIFRG